MLALCEVAVWSVGDWESLISSVQFFVAGKYVEIQVMDRRVTDSCPLGLELGRPVGSIR